MTLTIIHVDKVKRNVRIFSETDTKTFLFAFNCADDFPTFHIHQGLKSKRRTVGLLITFKGCLLYVDTTT